MKYNTRKWLEQDNPSISFSDVRERMDSQAREKWNNMSGKKLQRGG